MTPAADAAIRLSAYHADQCDPRKCTTTRLERHGLIRVFRRLSNLPRTAITLDPTAETPLSPADRPQGLASGLAVIDLSWKRGTMPRLPPRHRRRLPYLVAERMLKSVRFFSCRMSAAVTSAALSMPNVIMLPLNFALSVSK